MTEPVKVMAPMTMPAESSPIRTASELGAVLRKVPMADQHRRQTDEAVQGRHQLRHGGHLDAHGEDGADHGARRPRRR